MSPTVPLPPGSAAPPTAARPRPRRLLWLRVTGLVDRRATRRVADRHATEVVHVVHAEAQAGELAVQRWLADTASAVREERAGLTADTAASEESPPIGTRPPAEVLGTSEAVTWAVEARAAAGRERARAHAQSQAPRLAEREQHLIDLARIAAMTWVTTAALQTAVYTRARRGLGGLRYLQDQPSQLPPYVPVAALHHVPQPAVHPDRRNPT